MDKQIEEMTKETCGQQIYPYGKDRPICLLNNEDCTCRADNQCDHYEVCERIYNAGYRKIPEGAVVLTDDEYEKIYEQAEATILSNIADGGTSCHWYMNKHEEIGYKKGSKETVEKFAKMTRLKSRHAFVNVDDNPREDRFLYLTDIDEICKELVD